MSRHPCMRRKSRFRLWWLEHFGKRSCGLEGQPISEDTHYIVRVFYGGYWCEESLEGPFATYEQAAAIWGEEWDKGNGAIIYTCENATRLALDARRRVVENQPTGDDNA